MTAFSPFKLSRTIANHSNDVRSVELLKDGSVVTTSRDGKAILNSADGLTKTLVDGTSFLNAVSVDETCTRVFIGSHDSSIVRYDLDTGEQVFYLGHSANVSCLDCFGLQPLLASGSWDHTVRVWESPESSFELKAHTQNVWDVKFVDDTKLLSASADKTIKLWDLKTKSVIRTFTGHTDVIRSLVVLPNSQFVSASNDGTLRIWDLSSGELKSVLEGHTSFVYSLALAGTKYIVSGSEDRTVRIWDWQQRQCVQTIVLPSISQWSVAGNPNGDFVVGSSDNMARVFTQSAERQASKEELVSFEKSIRDSAFGENEIDESQIAHASVLTQPGKQEGQTVIVRNENTKGLEAHQFSGGVWSKIGDVVGQNQTSGSKRETYNGKQYDYVFDVDISEGAPPLKLPFNNSDNPYIVAETFIVENQLPPSYVEQVVQFLIVNSQAKNFDSHPSAASTSRSAPVSNEVPAVLKYSQLLSLKAFQQAPLLQALQKIADERGDNLSPYNIESLLSSLPSAASDLLKVAIELKGKWRDNLAHLLPVFDLLRIAIADASTIPYQVVWVNLLDALDADIPKHFLLAVRGVVNLVGRSDLDINNGVNKTMIVQAASMIQSAALRLQPVTKPVSVALSTLVLNLAIQQPSQLDFISLIRSVAPKIADCNDPEAVYRLALAVGLRSVASPTEAHSFKKAWFANAPAEERIHGLLEAVLPRID